MPIRVGLIGAGDIGKIRADAMALSSDCTLTAVADPDIERASKLVGGSNARVFANHQELLDWGHVDALFVSAPPQFHEPVTLDAFAAGKHVLCEKPMSHDVASCTRMVRAAREANLTLATGFNHRYFAAVKLVKSVLESGDLGELDHVRAFTGHMGLGELSKAAWMTDPSVMGGGALMDNGIHMIDLTRHVLGEVQDVMGHVGERVWKIPGAEDNGFALLRSTTDRTATLQASWSEWRGYRFSIAAYGTHGTAWAYYAPMLGTVVTMSEPGGKPTKRYEVFPKVNAMEKARGWQWNVIQTFLEEYRDFRGLIEGRPGTIAEGFDGLRAVEIAHAVRTSWEERRAITLCEPF